VVKTRVAIERAAGDAATFIATRIFAYQLHSHPFPGFAIMVAMQLLLYSAAWCRDCREAKRFLEQHKIPFTEIDIEATPGAAAEVIQNVGKRAIPQFVINGEWVQPYRPGQGFLYEEMTARLGLNARP
jgi:mycoredoxin